MQKITGSWALKVIVGCHVPYLIVQKDPEYATPIRVLFPVDYKLETKEKLKWMPLLSYVGKLKVVFLGQQGNGPMFDNPTRANMNFCKHYAEELNIDCEAVWTDEKESFLKMSLKYCEENNMDIIMITTTRDIAFHDVLRTKVLRLLFRLSGTRVYSIDKGRAQKRSLIAGKNRVQLKHMTQRYADVFRRAGFTPPPDRRVRPKEQLPAAVGSLPRQGIVESCLEFLRICKKENFHDVVIASRMRNG